jgi:type I site-specific restriction endonuclease
LVPDATKLEAETRKEIDEKLEAAGWVVQDKKKLNLYASPGVAVREVLMAEIIDQLDAALGEFHSVEEDLADTE